MKIKLLLSLLVAGAAGATAHAGVSVDVHLGVPVATHPIRSHVIYPPAPVYTAPVVVHDHHVVAPAPVVVAPPIVVSPPAVMHGHGHGHVNYAHGGHHESHHGHLSSGHHR